MPCSPDSEPVEPQHQFEDLGQTGFGRFGLARVVRVDQQVHVDVAVSGNIHVNLLVDPDDPRQAEAAEACLAEVFELVLRLDGSLSGEHGIGLVKRDYVGLEIGDAALALMHGIKHEFDPNGILNPDKALPLRG